MYGRGNACYGMANLWPPGGDLVDHIVTIRKKGPDTKATEVPNVNVAKVGRRAP